jgi:N-methylhydantoinase B
LLDYSARLMAAAIASIPDGVYRAEDFLDDDGVTDKQLRIAVTIRIRGKNAEVDFTGSAPQCAGSVNAVAAITESAIFYVFRCLLDEQVPATSGLMRSIRVIAPTGTISWVARASACSACNRFVIGERFATAPCIASPKRQVVHRALACRGNPRGDRASEHLEERVRTQSHMTNTLNTPTEVLEHIYPVRVHRYALRKGSGGDGKFRGGEGIVREIEMLADVQAGILSDRRKLRPYGLLGGSPGCPGKNEIVIKGHARRLPSKCTFRAPAGSIIRIETPGGGGWGKSRKVPRTSRRKEKSPKA